MPLGEGGSSTGVDYGRSRHAAKGRNGSSSESPIAGTNYQGGNVETRMMKSEPNIQICVEHWIEILILYIIVSIHVRFRGRNQIKGEGICNPAKYSVQ